MKKLTVSKIFALMLVLVMVCTLVLAACNKVDEEKDALENYELDKTSVISADFTLPKEIGDADLGGPFAVTWTSNNAAIVIEARENDYLAKVTLGDDITNVKLTMSLKSGKGSKSFDVRVAGIDVYSFVSNYVFTRNNATVSSGFALDTVATYKDKTATIAWSVEDEASKALIEVSGNQCLIKGEVSSSTKVKIRATFTYKEESAHKDFTFYLSEELEHLEQINQWYTVGGTVVMDGYVVAYGQNYQDRNSSLYVVDEDFCCGFYLYSINMDMTQVDKLVPGTPISVSGAAVQAPYYGIIETRNGNLVINEAKESVDLNEHIYAADNDLIGNWLEATYHTGSYASLTNWKVKSVNANPSGDRGVLLTLEKGGVEVGIGFNKYMEGSYKITGSGNSMTYDDTLTALMTKTKAIAKDSYVSVKGVLYSSTSNQTGPSSITAGGWQILPMSAADVTVGTEDTTATNDLVGTKIKTAINAVNSAVEAASIDGIVATHKEVTLPTTSNGVAISYRVCRGSSTVTIANDGKMTIEPLTNKEVRNIQVTYKVGEFETHTFFSVTTQALTDAQIVAQVKDSLAAQVVTTYEGTGTYDLPTDNDFQGVEVTWSLKGESTLVEVVNNQLKVKELPTQDTPVTIEVKAELNQAVASQEVTVTIKAGDTNIIAKFTFGVDDSSKTHSDGSGVTDGQDYVASTYGDYTLTLNDPYTVYKNAYDAQGNACLKLGTTSKFASFSFTVDDSVNYVKIYVAKYKTYSAGVKVNDGATQALTKNSDNGEYDVIVVDVRTNKTVKFETAELTSDTYHNGRAMIHMIEWCVNAD